MLALLADVDGEARRILRHLGCDLDRLSFDLEATSVEADEAVDLFTLVHSSTTKRAITLAAGESAEEGSPKFDSAHLLVAFVSLDGDDVGRALRACGLSSLSVRLARQELKAHRG